MRRPLLAVAFLVAVVAFAQQPNTIFPQPRISSVFPVGAKSGTNVDVTFIGTDLEESTALMFSHPGIKGEVIQPPADAPVDPKKKDAPKPKKNAPPPTEAKFKITVAGDVPPGAYDVRVVNRFGVSNPRLFVIGDKPEVNEKEPNNDTSEAQKVELNSVVNGVINSATDVDYTSFTAKSGQRVLVHCAASNIESKLKPLVELFAPDGKRLATARNYQGTDALADILIPSDGDYLVRLTEFAHQSGSADHFYRLTITNAPWIDAVHPPMIEPGKATNVTVYGRNLPGGKAVPGLMIDGRPIESVTTSITPPIQPGQNQHRRRVDPPTGLQDGFEYRLGNSNAFPMFLSRGPITLEKDGNNDKPETAEAISVPAEIAGRIEKRYDRDWYSFTAKKGEIFMVELYADRIGSGIDGFLSIRNAKSKGDIANEGTLDDDAESLHPTSYFSRSTDPAPFKFTAPEDGTFQVMVGSRDANVNYGVRSYYVLRVTPAKPDFRAIVMPRSRELPHATIARADGEVGLDVFVHRIDGFTGPVTVTAAGLPNGVTAKPTTIGHNQKWGTLVLSAATLTNTESQIKVMTTATIDGKPVVREARPASITWGIPGQQNIPTVVRLEQSLVLALRTEKSPFRLVPDFAKATKKVDGKDATVSVPFVLKPGDKLTVPVKVVWQEKEPRPNVLNVTGEQTAQNQQLVALTVNNGQPTPTAKDKNEAIITVDVKNLANPGTYSVALRGDTLLKYSKDPMGKDKKDLTAFGYAEPFEIKVIPKSVANLNAQSPGNVKQGATAELVLKVERQFDFDGEFQVKIELPKEAMGLTIDAQPIPAKANEVKLKITAAKDAKMGAINNINVTATAKWEGQHETKHETKFNLNVVK